MNATKPVIDIDSLAAGVAAVMGWTVKPRDTMREGAHYAEIHGPAGEMLGMFRDGDKVRISGQFPDQLDGRSVWSIPYSQTRPAINVSPTKRAEVIAADIGRRLLPAYRPMLADCKARVQAYANAHTRANETAAMLAGIAGGTFKAAKGDASRAEVELYRSSNLPESTADFYCNGENVKIENLYVSAETAAEIMRVLIAAKKRETPAAE